MNDIKKWNITEIILTSTIFYSNPFITDIFATFISPTGKILKVNGFYDGNGSGEQNGNVWKIRFMPNEIGNWSFETISSDPQLNNITNSFKCIPSNNKGIIERDLSYPFSMKYIDGEHFFQNGCDDPEDFLSLKFGSTNMQRFATIDYLSSVGVNDIYFGLVNGCPGDGGITSRVDPWIGTNCPPTDYFKFDIPKMYRWDEVFRYIRDKEIVINLVLLLEDSGGLTTSLKTDWNKMEFFLREIISRFSSYPNIIWNIAEEYGEFLTQNQVKTIAQFIRDNDPYKHLITVHQNNKNTFDFAGDNRFDLATLQYSTFLNPIELNSGILTCRNQVESSGRIIPVSITEWSQVPSSSVTDCRKAVWAISMAGGVYEIHLESSELITLSDLTKWDTQWKQATICKNFMDSIQYYKLKPNNHIVITNNAFVLEKPGEVYIIYIINGGTVTVNLSSSYGLLNVEWFNPRTGTYQGQTTTTQVGTLRSFISPDSNDWVLHIYCPTPKCDFTITIT